MKDLTQSLFSEKQILLPRYTLEEKRLRGKLISGDIKLLIVAYTNNVDDEAENKVQSEIFQRLTSRLPDAARPEFIYYTELKQFDLNIFFTCGNLNTILFCGVIPYLKGRVINKSEMVQVNTKYVLSYEGIQIIDKDIAVKKQMWNQLVSTFK